MADSGVDFQEHELEACYKAAVEIAEKAGRVINDAFHKEKTFLTKSTSADLVTETDKKVEQMIISFLREKFPTHCFIGEESTEKVDFTNQPTWMIDPVDGTTNFVHRFPFVAVSIALCVQKEVVLGVVHNAINGNTYTAKKGQGSYLNGTQIRANKTTELRSSMMIQEFGCTRDPESISFKQRNLTFVLKSGVHGVRSVGSAALNLCLVACGSADGYFEFGLHCWDYAAGALILTEAGGVVMDTEGGPLDLLSRRMIATATEPLAKVIQENIENVELERD